MTTWVSVCSIRSHTHNCTKCKFKNCSCLWLATNMVGQVTERDLSSKLAEIQFAIDDLTTEVNTWYTLLCHLLQISPIFETASIDEKIEYEQLFSTRIGKIIDLICLFVLDEAPLELSLVLTDVFFQIKFVLQGQPAKILGQKESLSDLKAKLDLEIEAEAYSTLKEAVRSLTSCFETAVPGLLISQPSTVFSTFATTNGNDSRVVRPRKRLYRDLTPHAFSSLDPNSGTVICSPKRQRCATRSDFRYHSIDVSLVPSWMDRLFPDVEEPEKTQRSSRRHHFMNRVKRFFDFFKEPTTGCRKCIFLPWHRFFHKT